MKLLVFALDVNPYQQLLYDALRRQDPRVRVHLVRRWPVIGALLFPLMAPIYRLAGYRTLHVHWPKFGLEIRTPWGLRASTVLTRLSLRAIDLLGFRVVWTVHNVVPHQRDTTDDAAVSRAMTALADVTIAHSQATVDELAALGADVSRAVVIPHGNYDGVYPGRPAQDVARERLGLAPDDFVVLFFGLVKPYKGIDTLLDAYANLDRPSARLVIAGQGAPEAVRQRAAELGALYAGRRIADDEVTTYFAAADVVCLPFTSVTTSGSALLALTLGRPIVVPALGGLTELPSDVCLRYDPDDGDALVAALRSAYDDRQDTTRRGDAARAFAAGLSWDSIAARTLPTYRE